MLDGRWKLEDRGSSLNRNDAVADGGARSSRPLPSASRRRAGSDHLGALFGEWILPPHLFGETPNRATGTVALPCCDCMVPAQNGDRLWARRSLHAAGIATTTKTEAWTPDSSQQPRFYRRTRGRCLTVAVARAAQVLSAGELVALPTETVYGLAANALDARAVARIFEVKGRPPQNPIIVARCQHRTGAQLCGGLAAAGGQAQQHVLAGGR